VREKSREVKETNSERECKEKSEKKGKIKKRGDRRKRIPAQIFLFVLHSLYLQI
jgi:hypothetical protein